MTPKPIVRWAGGKWRTRHVLLDALPVDVDQRRHVECFAGSLALWLARGAPAGAFLNDGCLPLMGVYQCLASPQKRAGLIRALERHAQKHSRRHYLRMRERFNQAPDALLSTVCAADAARFLYLNRASYNGLLRFNQAGSFNTPYGGDEREIRLPPLKRLGQLLASVTLRSFDIIAATTLCPAGAGDFVYLDPPYAPETSQSFAQYGSRFSFEEHLVLRDAAERWTGLGAKVMISNSDTPFTRDIYRRWRVRSVRSTRSIGGKGAKRGAVGELLITNY